jgi:malate/lactate dehydrogenase
VDGILQYFSTTQDRDTDFKRVVEFLSTQLIVDIENIRKPFLDSASDDMIEKLDYLGVCLWNESLNFDLLKTNDEEIDYLIASLKSAGYILIELATLGNMDNYGTVDLPTPR